MIGSKIIRTLGKSLTILFLLIEFCFLRNFIFPLDPYGLCSTWIPINLPEGFTYNPANSRPQNKCWVPVGDWHVTHEQLVITWKRCPHAAIWSRDIRGNCPVRMKSDSVVLTHQPLHPNLAKTRSDPRPSIDEATHPNSLWILKNAVYVYGLFCTCNEPQRAMHSLLAAYHFCCSANENWQANWENNRFYTFEPGKSTPDGLNRFASWR